MPESTPTGERERRGDGEMGRQRDEENLSLPLSVPLLSHSLPRSSALVFFLGTALLLLSQAGGKAQEDVRVSKLGQYRGYSQPIYSEWVRTSEYVAVRDGTKLAVDIFRPAKNRVPVGEPLPVLWTHHRYHRADLREGRLITELEQSPWLQTILTHGYVIGVVDVRGGGASMGTRQGELTREEARDAYDITEWFARQPWCNGRIGMYGRSYLGIAQYMAASADPPHLVAIFPQMAVFDLYSFLYPGGVFRQDFARQWSEMVSKLDTERLAAPVDQDRDGALLTRAAQAHQANRNVFATISTLPYRDSRDPAGSRFPYREWSPSSYVSKIRKSGVGIYHLGGWFDLWPRDALVWFNNLDNRQKIVIGPWSHGQSAGLDLAVEHLRWYDYWLKGIDNGIVNEPPIHYYTMGAPEGQRWRAAWQWPLPNEKPTRFYFHAGPSGSVQSINDGLLSPQPPTSPDDRDDYPVDYTASSGAATRWTNGYGGPFGYPDMTSNDQKGLTYTTPPLPSHVEVTGHPVIHLWATSTDKSVDFFAYLEEVDPMGRSQYITEGVLRASCRATSPPPFNYWGLPYRRGLAEDIADRPSGVPVELIFDLHPTSNLFDQGHRIRLTITGADKDNAQAIELSPPPTASIHRNAGYASYLTLPIIPAGPENESGPVMTSTPSHPPSNPVAPQEESGWLTIILVVSAITVATALIVVLKR